MAHLAQVREIARPLGIGFLGLGMSAEMDARARRRMMPKGRYRIMTNYMPKVGTLGLDMMYRTCTVQTNLDFSSEADMVKKLRVSLALQPVATALFANSPFTEGKPNGFLSFRSEIWRDTDNQRAGMLPFAFEDGMGFERYVDYALDVPMYFVKREDSISTCPANRSAICWPASCRATAIARDAVRLGEPRLDDFSRGAAEALLEMRGADGGPWRRLPALPAFWVGILYDDASARCRVGSGEGLERRGTAEAARRRAAPGLQGRRSAARTCSSLRTNACALARSRTEAPRAPR